MFERYALGNVSATQLEDETGLAATHIRMILMNPLYNGWIRRHRGKNETRRPARLADNATRLGRAVGQGGGGPANQDPRRWTEELGSRRSARRPP